jgi:hypothetical protein
MAVNGWGLLSTWGPILNAVRRLKEANASPFAAGRSAPPQLEELDQAIQGNMIHHARMVDQTISPPSSAGTVLRFAFGMAAWLVPRKGPAGGGAEDRYTQENRSFDGYQMPNSDNGSSVV